MIKHCALEDIMRTSNLLPFEKKDVSSLALNCKKLSEKELIARFHPSWAATPQEALDQMIKGVFVLHCPQIEMDFVYTCENGGIGLFGRQKRIFKVYGGDYQLDDFTPSTSFRSFIIAVTSVNNIFRGRGLLQGMV